MAENSQGTRRGKRGGRGRGGIKTSAVPLKTAGGMNRAQLMQALSSWDAARRSERRGNVVIPSLDPQKRISPTDRKEIAGKVEAGEQNVGFVKRAISGVAQLVGNLKPQADTGNSDFDEEIEERLGKRFDHPRAFDAAGNMDFWDWQTWVRECKVR